MTQNRGVVLINALVVVLAIAAVATALLLRSEQGRMRLEHVRTGDQLGLYLDAGERLFQGLLRQVDKDTVTHFGQNWASGQTTVIDRGRISVTLQDLQGRLNVNWLTGPEDEYARAVFQDVFLELGLPQSLLAEMSARLRARGPARTVEDLRAFPGMTQAAYGSLKNVLSALPRNERLNLNTAPDVVIRAAIKPLPAPLQTEILSRDTPILAMADLRQRAIELLETEEIDHLNLERLTYASTWFRAETVAELDGHVRKRAAILRVSSGDIPPVQRVMRWAVHD